MSRPILQVSSSRDTGKERVDGAERPSTLNQVWSIRLAVASIPQSVNEVSVDPLRGTTPPPWSRIAALTRLPFRRSIALVVAAALTFKLGALLDAVAPTLDEVSDCPRTLEVEGAAPRVVVLVAPELEQVELRNVALDDERTHFEHDGMHVLKLAAPVVPVRTTELKNVARIVMRFVVAPLVRQVQGHARLALRILELVKPSAKSP